MSDVMKVAIWRLILTYQPRAAIDHRLERSEQPLLEAGGTGAHPKPTLPSYRHEQITDEIANHRFN